MPKLSGLSLLKTMQYKPSVIITTAYPEYAVEGFELAVTDYLLKPFSFERFLKAVMKVQNPKVSETYTTQKTSATQPETIFVKSDKKLIKLQFDTISHVEAYGNYIKIYTDIMILVPQTLSNFLNELPDYFLRIHKSYIINFEHLKPEFD